MKVLLVKWKAYGQEFLQRGLERTGACVDTIFYDAEKCGISEQCSFLEPLCEKLKEKVYDVVISFNYFPVISTACELYGIKYAAWTVDSPLYTLYMRSIYNSCNYFFVFDKQSLNDLKEMGIRKVWYLPLAAAEYADIIQNSPKRNQYQSQVSFVGNLYSEKSAYHLLGPQQDYFAGFMEGLVEAQQKIWGYSFVEKILAESWGEQMAKILVAEGSEEYIGRPEKMFANSCLLVETTARERRTYLEYASRETEVDIYTGSDTTMLTGLHNRGKVDYMTEMPMVFHNSRININITLRTIQQGISLRVWDVLACGGFLLTNYQPELEEFFEIGKDLECYMSKEDLVSKIRYYLEHDEERARIAQNGYEKVKEHHTYEKRVQEIMEKING